MDINFDLRDERNGEEPGSIAMAAGGGSKAAFFSKKEGPIAEKQEEEGGSLAGSSATKIKLKIPKLTEEPVDYAAKEFSHICKQCGKGFSSGKALGGHMSSAHVQAAKEKLKAKRCLLDGSSDEEKHICGICQKEFPSSKSLYGHMRLHPERQYRGMEPPDHPHRLLPFQNVRQQVVGEDREDNYDDLDFSEEGIDPNSGYEMGRAQYDLLDLVGRGWGKTRRRGEKFGVKIFDVGDFADEEEETKVYQAARELVMLARGPLTHGPPIWVNNSFAPTTESAESGRYEFPLKKRISNQLVIYSSSDDDFEENDDSDETLMGNVNFGNGKSPMYSSSSLGMDFGEGDVGRNRTSLAMDFDEGDVGRKRTSLVMDFNQGGDVGGDVGRKRKRVAGKTSIEAQQVLTPLPLQETYKCSTCNKTFSTHQALGGHRSSHNKVKIHVQNAVDQVNLEEFRSPSTKLTEWSGGDCTDQISTLHGCEVCGKSFATGQALGGHKRCHYTGSSSAAQSPSPLDGIGGEKLERKIHEFDLNVPPADDDDQDL